MDRLAVPWLLVGPSGSGKASLARRWIEEAHGVKLVYPLEVRTFSVGDGYEARVLASPYHFEIDIPNLSMQDKQIIGELLTMFLSSGDVLNSLRSSTRKLVILRRAHCLSLPAAIRVRAILQQYVLPANASGMIWMTAREVTGSLSLLEDALVRHRVPRMSLATWAATVPPGYQTETAWLALEGRPERAKQMAAFFPDGPPNGEWPRRIQDFYDELVLEMLKGAEMARDPDMNTVLWLRGRVYDALSFCQTGPEIVDSCASAVTRLFQQMDPRVFQSIMDTLATSEPHTSYRTPLSLEWAFLNMFEVMRKTLAEINGGGGTKSKNAQAEACAQPQQAVTPATAAAAAAAATKKAAPRAKRSGGKSSAITGSPLG